MNKSLKSVGIIVVVLVIAAYMSIFTIQQGQEGLLLRLGKLETDRQTGEPKVFMPGLHFKMPLVSQAKSFDTRLQTLDAQSSLIVTQEKKDVRVDYYVKWRINNLALYFTRTGGYASEANARLERQVNDSLRAQFGQRTISEVVSGERADIMGILTSQANEKAQILGIEVVDVRIKSIDLPTEVSNAVFERMRTERQRIANQHRADGTAAAEAIRAGADARVTVVLARAGRESQIMRGEGDGEAAGIYSAAYGQDAEFFSFYRTMNAYIDAFSGKEDFLVLNPDGEFFQYFNQADGTAQIQQNDGNTD